MAVALVDHLSQEVLPVIRIEHASVLLAHENELNVMRKLVDFLFFNTLPALHSFEVLQPRRVLPIVSVLSLEHLLEDLILSSTQ